jgi:hypothetical protein
MQTEGKDSFLLLQLSLQMSVGMGGKVKSFFNEEGKLQSHFINTLVSATKMQPSKGQIESPDQKGY